jgi:hypothetical protein
LAEEIETRKVEGGALSTSERASPYPLPLANSQYSLSNSWDWHFALRSAADVIVEHVNAIRCHLGFDVWVAVTRLKLTVAGCGQTSGEMFV